MANFDPQEIHVAAAALRRVINETGYGVYVSDAIVQQGAVAAVTAVEQYRAGAAEHIKEAEKARDAQAAEQKAEDVAADRAPIFLDSLDTSNPNAHPNSPVADDA